MYDINVYQYENKPFMHSGKYGILPLNDKGLGKYYLGNNTHTRYYLNKFNPIIFSQPDQQEEPKAFDTIINEKMGKKVLEPISNQDEMNKKSKFALQVSKSTPSLENNAKKTKKNVSRNHKISGLSKEKVVNHQKNQTINQENSKNIINSKLQNIKKNISIKLQTSSVKTENCKSSNNIFTHSNHCYSPTMPMEIRKSESPLKYYTESLAKSIQDTINFSSDQKTSREIDKIKQENMNLKTALDEQSDINFLKKTKLPDIIKIKNSQNQIIKKIRIGNSKYLSEKYDPSSLCFSYKSHVGRNFVGGKYNY